MSSDGISGIMRSINLGRTKDNVTEGLDIKRTDLHAPIPGVHVPALSARARVYPIAPAINRAMRLICTLSVLAERPQQGGIMSTYPTMHHALKFTPTVRPRGALKPPLDATKRNVSASKMFQRCNYLSFLHYIYVVEIMALYFIACLL